MDKEASSGMNGRQTYDLLVYVGLGSVRAQHGFSLVDFASATTDHAYLGSSPLSPERLTTWMYFSPDTISFSTLPLVPHETAGRRCSHTDSHHSGHANLCGGTGL